MSFTEAIASGFRNYANFYDRASRSEFWYWYLFFWLAMVAAIIVDHVVFGARLFGMLFGGQPFDAQQAELPVANLVNLALALPVTSITARRLHDIDRSGWWMLLGIIPIIGWIVLLVWYCKRGTVGPNRFGPDPLGEHRLDLAETQPISFTDAIASGFRNYVNFSDRANGSEFWYWFLFAVLLTGVAGLIDRGLFGSEGYPAIGSLASLAIFLPTLGIAVRRLHDLDRSGWWVLLSLILVIGWIVLIVWYCKRGTAGPNRFGPDPLTGKI
jgi:uncharacterized membrane protein YhaH (DUF805 family)